MAFLNHKVTGEITKELLAAGDGVELSSISLCNVRNTHTAIVDLYIQRKLPAGKTTDASYGEFYIFKNTIIPAGVTLTHNFSFDNNKFGLFVKLTKTDTVTLTGSIDPAASTSVTGVGTAFLTEVGVGDELVVSGETRIVTAITSNTALTVGSAFSNNSNDTSPDINPVAAVDIVIT
tara:strand:+ start:134 stop:664 length:531 start_codon:yes stop_codon:yes gene_type:complete